jgi:hypothetical protein
VKAVGVAPAGGFDDSEVLVDFAACRASVDLEDPEDDSGLIFSCAWGGFEGVPDGVGAED